MEAFDDFTNEELDPVEAVCEQHGPYTSKRSRFMKRVYSTTCPQCSEIEKAKKAEEERIAEENKKRERWEKTLADCGIGRRHMYKTFDNYAASTREKQNALATCKTFSEAIEARRATGGLLLIGKPGTGKTHLSCAVINSLASKGMWGYRENLRDVLAEVKSTYGKGSEHTELDVIGSYGRRRLLVIDEVGAFQMSEHEKAIFTSLMDKRYENELPTVLVSNLDFEGLKTEIGERNIDRLREDGGKVVQFTWESHRA